VTVKTEPEAHGGTGDEARPAPAQPALTDPKSLADGDVPTSPGIGPSGAGGTDAPDEAAKTAPFIRAVDGGEGPVGGPASSLSVDLDGGWSLETTEKMPAAPSAPPPSEPAPKATTTLAGPGSPMPAAAAVEEPAPAPSAPASAEPASVEPAKAEASATPEAKAAPAAEPSPVAAPAPAAPAEPAKAAEPAPAAPEAEKDTAPARPSPVKAAPAPVAAPGAPIQVKVFGRTDVGLVREHNEDNFLIADLTTGNRSLLPEVRQHTVGARGSLFVVCDGMGGAAAGEVASLLAVDTIYEILQGSEAPRNGVDLARTMVDSIEEGGRRIFSAARLDRSRRGMGTTVTGACLLDGTLYLAQVGDSRAYVVRGTQIEQVTRDQSLVNQLIEAGQLTEEEAEAFEHSNIILQALGTAAEVSVDVTHVPLRRGDILLLCSDGLSGAVTSEQMKEVVLSTPEAIEACKKLTEMANAAGGHDNITVIVAQFDGESLPAPQPDDRVTFQRVSLPPGPRSSQPPQATPTDVAPTPPTYRQTQPDIDGPLPMDAGADAVPRSSGGITILLLLLALLVGAAVAYVFFSGMLTASAPAGSSSVPSAVAAPLPAAATPQSGTPAGPASVPIVSRALGSVTFRSSAVGARLRVDGLDRGAFENGRITLDLPVGSHDAAVLVDGVAVVARPVVVAPDGTNDFGLEEPGAAPDAPAPLAPVAPVPAGVAPPEPEPAPVARPEPRPRIAPPSAPVDPAKSPQRLVPPLPAGGDVPGQQF